MACRRGLTVIGAIGLRTEKTTNAIDMIALEASAANSNSAPAEMAIAA